MCCTPVAAASFSALQRVGGSRRPFRSHRADGRRRCVVTAARQGPMQAVAPPAPPPPTSPGPVFVGSIIGLQAVALIGAVVTGVLARRRRVEMQGLNTKLRQINSELRRQREAQDAILAAISLAATPQAGAESDAGSSSSSSSSSEGPEVAAALEALRLQREALQQERSVLEQALASPSAAHPTEGFGDQRLSLAHARRRIAKCIRGGKELVRDGRPSEAYPIIEQGLQLALETADLRAERALMRVRARALRDAGDPASSLRDLQRSIALSEQLGEGCGDADTFGELGDILTELGDLEAAGQYYDRCISAIQTEGQQPLSSTWDMS